MWDGISNNLALRHLRQMKKGDTVFFYHSGTVRANVGIAEVVSSPSPDPALKDPRRVVVDLSPKEPLSIAKKKGA